MKIRDSLNQKDKLKINRHNKLYVAEYLVNLSNDRHTMYYDSKMNYPEFILVDPISPSNSIKVKVEH